MDSELRKHLSEKYGLSPEPPAPYVSQTDWFSRKIKETRKKAVRVGFVAGAITGIIGATIVWLFPEMSFLMGIVGIIVAISTALVAIHFFWDEA